MKASKVLTLALAVVMVVGLCSGCSSSSTAPAASSAPPASSSSAAPAASSTPPVSSSAAAAASSAAPEQTKMEMYLGVGSMGGAFYPLGQAMATLVAKYSGGLTMIPEVTGGAVDNVRQVGKGDDDIGITAENNAYDGLDGVEPYTEKYDLVGIARLHPSALHCVVLADSPIQSIEDLRGKKVTLGAAGSGGIPVAEKMLAEYGMTFDDIVANYLPTADGFTQLGDGNIDAAIGLFGIPGSACQELAATKKIRFIDIDPKVLDAMVEKYPYYAKVDIDKSVYETEEGTTTVATVNCLICRRDLPDNAVYWLTKSIFDNGDELHSLNDTSKYISQESASKITIELHPGAKMYWDEVAAGK